MEVDAIFSGSWPFVDSIVARLVAWLPSRLQPKTHHDMVTGGSPRVEVSTGPAVKV
jgi:hypothetical protein